ncbi:DUF6415 family natural product biosynthesis protein [Streptomyces bottropensis]|uniref:DUF6415 family natural product biosynthesis protein n=1 Tax=Streptomyces bottropensis TaxID=42235 RepID=UPI0036BD616C
MTSVVVRRGSDAAPGWDHPVEPARRLEGVAVAEALAKIRAWNPYDGDAWLDDVADALDPVALPEDKVGELGERLRGYLMQLVAMAVRYEAEKRDERAASLIDRAREVREQEMPGDYAKSVAHLRRMGWAVNELLDLLVESGITKEPDSLRDDLLPTGFETQKDQP